MRKGVLLAVGAYLLWGLFPMYWPLLEPAGAVEILAHRMVWSAVVMAIGITALRHWRAVRAIPARTWMLIGLAAILVALNWGVYIYAVNNEHVLEASLGYFMLPVVSVGLGVLVLRERLGVLQWLALIIAVVGVAFTALGSHGFPYLAVTLAVSFGLYGLIKRVITVPAAISLLGESSVLVLPALGYLVWLQVDGQAHFTGYGAGHITVMVLSGLVTAIPLLMFGAAAQLLPLSLLGFIQYLNPLTQFLLGTVVFDEQMSVYRWAGFAVIWVALLLLSAEAMRRGRRGAAGGRRATGLRRSGELVAAGEGVAGVVGADTDGPDAGNRTAVDNRN